MEKVNRSLLKCREAFAYVYCQLKDGPQWNKIGNLSAVDKVLHLRKFCELFYKRSITGDFFSTLLVTTSPTFFQTTHTRHLLFRFCTMAGGAALRRGYHFCGQFRTRLVSEC